MQFNHETIEHKARHFERWHPTTEMRLQQLGAMAEWASHFNPQWKVGNMIGNAIDLFAALEKYEARYLVMGGFAAVIYGVPHFTNDVDLFIEGTEENIGRVIDALIELGSDQAELFKTLNSTIVSFIKFVDLPVKTDVMVNVPGLTWETAWENRERKSYQDQPFYAISRADLVAAKRTAGRWQDLEDVKALEATGEQK